MDLIDSALTYPKVPKQNVGFIHDCLKLHLKELIVKMNESDYHDFLRIANEYGLTVEEKIYEIIDYYLLKQSGRFKTCRFSSDST